MDKCGYERNIKLMYILSGVLWGRFFVPVLALFYVASQVPLDQFAIIMGVFSLSILLFEVPSGVVADLFGKKNTLLLSRGLFLVEVFMLATLNGFWPFFIAKVISGIGVSLTSGTSSSLLFDTLKKLKRTPEHKYIFGKQYMISQFSQAVVFIVGAFLFTIYYKLPAYVSLVFLLVGFILTFYLVEPYPSKVKMTMQTSWIHLKKGFTLFTVNSTFWFLVLFSLPLAFVTEISLPFSSVYFALISIPVALIGVVAFVGSILMGFGSKWEYKIESYLGTKSMILWLAIVCFIAMLLEAFVMPYLGLLFYFIILFISGMRGILINNQAQEQVSQKHRATMISILNLFKNLGIFLVFMLVSKIIKLFSLQVAYFVVSGLLLVGLIVAGTYYIYKAKDKKIKFIVH